MGAIYFFSDVLSDTQLNGIHALGPGYFFCFEPSTIPQLDSKNTHYGKPSPLHMEGLASIMDGSLSQKVFLSYNPAVGNEESFLDNTPGNNDIKWLDDVSSDLNISSLSLSLPLSSSSTTSSSSSSSSSRYRNMDAV